MFFWALIEDLELITRQTSLKQAFKVIDNSLKDVLQINERISSTLYEDNIFTKQNDLHACFPFP